MVHGLRNAVISLLLRLTFIRKICNMIDVLELGFVPIFGDSPIFLASETHKRKCRAVASDSRLGATKRLRRTSAACNFYGARCRPAVGNLPLRGDNFQPPRQ